MYVLWFVVFLVVFLFWVGFVGCFLVVGFVDFFYVFLDVLNLFDVFWCFFLVWFLFEVLKS